MKVEIYIATHKAYNYPKIDGYIPIHVGKALTDLDLGIIGDNTGDHISGLNPNFCELTALYWMWKNSDADILGLVHYRRYFFGDIMHSNDDFKKYKILNPSYIEEIIKNERNTVILAKPEKLYYRKFKLNFKVGMRQQYELNHYKSDWDNVRKIIENKFPDYMVSLDKVEKMNDISFYNMFIAHKKVVNDYCDWLFSILFELKNITDISQYNTYQSRIFGFISERLLNVYFYHRFHVLYIPVVMI